MCSPICNFLVSFLSSKDSATAWVLNHLYFSVIYSLLPTVFQAGSLRVHGVAMPTMKGIVNVLNHIGAQKKGKQTQVLWHSLREEPVRTLVTDRKLSISSIRTLNYAHHFKTTKGWKLGMNNGF